MFLIHLTQFILSLMKDKEVKVGADKGAEDAEDQVKVIRMNEVIEEDKAMKVFFEKHPVDLDELTAVKMILKKVESAKKKCEEGDKTYLDDLAKIYEMTEDFFSEMDLNPASLL